MPSDQPTGPTLQTQSTIRQNASNPENAKNFGLTRCVFATFLGPGVTADEVSLVVYGDENNNNNKNNNNSENGNGGGGGGVIDLVKNMSENSIDDRNLSGGLVILSNSSILGFVEAPDSKVNMLIKTLVDSKKIGELRVLSTTFDIPNTVYNLDGFTVYSCNPTSEDNVDVQSEGSIIIANTIQNILLSNAKGLPVVNAYEKSIILLNKHECASLPSSNRVLACAKSQCYATSQEYLSMYENEFNVTCESHYLWPLQSVVQLHDTTTV